MLFVGIIVLLYPTLHILDVGHQFVALTRWLEIVHCNSWQQLTALGNLQQHWLEKNVWIGSLESIRNTCRFTHWLAIYLSQYYILLSNFLSNYSVARWVRNAKRQKYAKKMWMENLHLVSKFGYCTFYCVNPGKKVGITLIWSQVELISVYMT